MREAEVRSLGAIAAASIARPSTVARDVHGAVAGRVFSLLGPLGIAARAVHDRASRVAYGGVAAALPLIPRAAGAAAARVSGADARALADSQSGSLALAALNGFAGDRLARDHPALALELGLRERGRSVAVEPAALVAAYPDATERLVVFVHGLCETEGAWSLGVPGGVRRPTYGELLREELGFTPLHVRYNTGLHISDNGRRLASTLESVVQAWPVEAREIVLIGHSMGGLVLRSACHYGARAGHAWTERVRHVVCLGSPHLGAPLERAANVAGWTLSRLPEMRPFADLFLNDRSAGIKDLRFGNCVEEDWCDCDPDEFLRDRCREVPFLEDASYYFVAATLSRSSDGVGGLVGDLLVHHASASGRGRRRRIGFAEENGRHLPRAHHLQLLNHPGVHEALRGWLATERVPLPEA